MKKIYESFQEIADDFCHGDGFAHRGSDHTPAECIGWQNGIREFARWLDDAGGRLLCEPDIYKKLWDTYIDRARVVPPLDHRPNETVVDRENGKEKAAEHESQLGVELAASRALARSLEQAEARLARIQELSQGAGDPYALLRKIRAVFKVESVMPRA
jgi:hypothetical protein